jgi:hypothetical protein
VVKFDRVFLDSLESTSQRKEDKDAELSTPPEQEYQNSLEQRSSVMLLI